MKQELWHPCTVKYVLIAGVCSPGSNQTKLILAVCKGHDSYLILSGQYLQSAARKAIVLAAAINQTEIY